MQPPTTFRKFLDLPPELRLITIEMYLQDHIFVNSSDHIHRPTLLFTNKQVRAEALKPYLARLETVYNNIEAQMDIISAEIGRLTPGSEERLVVVRERSELIRKWSILFREISNAKDEIREMWMVANGMDVDHWKEWMKGLFACERIAERKE